MCVTWLNYSCVLERAIGGRTCIGCLKLQVSFRERATNYRALLRKMTCEQKASYASSPPCITTDAIWASKRKQVDFEKKIWWCVCFAGTKRPYTILRDHIPQCDKWFHSTIVKNILVQINDFSYIPLYWVLYRHRIHRGSLDSEMKSTTSSFWNTQHTATHCDALYHTTALCKTLRHTATRCNTRQTLQHCATHCNTPQHSAMHCNTLQCTAMHCNALQCTATHCNTLQHTATHCNSLQLTATHCNSLQHTSDDHGVTICTCDWSCIGNTLQHTMSRCNSLQLTATHCNALQLTATHCNSRQLTVMHCNSLQLTATLYNSLQLTAIHCNSLQLAATQR